METGVIGVAIATLCATAVGVFIDVAVITVAPIALSIARSRPVKSAILLAMVGGGKAGNVMSPNERYCRL